MIPNWMKWLFVLCNMTWFSGSTLLTTPNGKMQMTVVSYFDVGVCRVYWIALLVFPTSDKDQNLNNWIKPSLDTPSKQSLRLLKASELIEPTSIFLTLVNFDVSISVTSFSPEPTAIKIWVVSTAMDQQELPKLIFFTGVPVFKFETRQQLLVLIDTIRFVSGVPLRPITKSKTVPPCANWYFSFLVGIVQALTFESFEQEKNISFSTITR